MFELDVTRGSSTHTFISGYCRKLGQRELVQNCGGFDSPGLVLELTAIAVTATTRRNNLTTTFSSDDDSHYSNVTNQSTQIAFEYGLAHQKSRIFGAITVSQLFLSHGYRLVGFGLDRVPFKPPAYLCERGPLVASDCHRSWP